MTIGFCTQDFISIKIHLVECSVDLILTLYIGTIFGLKAFYILALGNAQGM